MSSWLFEVKGKLVKQLKSKTKILFVLGTPLSHTLRYERGDDVGNQCEKLVRELNVKLDLTMSDDTIHGFDVYVKFLGIELLPGAKAMTVTEIDCHTHHTALYNQMRDSFCPMINDCEKMYLPQEGNTLDGIFYKHIHWFDEIYSTQTPK
jgi:hypothetical protein